MDGAGLRNDQHRMLDDEGGRSTFLVALRRYDRVLIPEMNLGQLLKLVRAEFLVDAVGYNRVRGLPFRAAELEQAILALVEQ